MTMPETMPTIFAALRMAQSSDEIVMRRLCDQVQKLWTLRHDPALVPAARRERIAVLSDDQRVASDDSIG